MRKHLKAQIPRRAEREPEVPSDVLGSYTGCPIGPDDEPVQDADDL